VKSRNLSGTAEDPERKIPGIGADDMATAQEGKESPRYCFRIITTASMRYDIFASWGVLIKIKRALVHQRFPFREFHLSLLIEFNRRSERGVQECSSLISITITDGFSFGKFPREKHRDCRQCPIEPP